jgi:hypothetical protein
MMHRSHVRLACAAAVLAVATGVAGCSSGTPTAASSSGASASPSATPSATRSTPAPSSVGPTPTPGPSVVGKVKRSGGPSTPTVSAAASSFAKAVAYPDGLTVDVSAISSGVESGQGLGQFAGREFTVFSVRLTNGTKAKLDLQSVVLTATYGKKNLVAERVYADDVDAKDFGGVLAAGRTADARYAFAVPKGALGDVRLVIDFDAAHTSAQFDGDARKAG